ncbi:hypothetical protein scyTo_0014415 [Scyliorhinus torazame]|uniref:CWH43-like N-terminal domain-containing protein n=1 Tax=Scyliorhinus torazame TaxID=75743 RepID=A0A401NM30_SCYTO|nr:hypothetical protein [Scyliorhinus torazame]
MEGKIIYSVALLLSTHAGQNSDRQGCGHGVYSPFFWQSLRREALGPFTWVCVIRYQQVIDYGHQSALNIVSLVAGCLCAVGGSMVGNFQTVNQIHVHLVGAFLAFFIGNVYFWLQAALTYKIQPRHGGKWIGPVRIICSLVCTVCLCLVVLLHSLNKRTAAAICEWVAAMVLLLLFGLFAVDFRHIHGHYFHVIQEKSRIQNSTTTLEL